MVLWHVNMSLSPLAFLTFPSSLMADEKVPVATDEPKAKKKSPNAPDVDIDEKDPNNSITEVKQADPEQVSPVSFRQLFRSGKSLGIFWGQRSSSYRYSTTFELCLDAIGIIPAGGAGAAQVCSYFLTAREEGLSAIALTSQVSTFRKPNATISSEQVAAAAATFRHAGGQSAAGLVYIGEFKHNACMLSIFKKVTGVGLFVCTNVYMFIWNYPGEINAKRIRERYLQAALRTGCCFL